MAKKWLVIIDPNGVGKNSFVKALPKFLPYSGEITSMTNHPFGRRR